MSRFRPSILLLALCFASLWACEKVALLAPTGSKVTISISKTSVAIGGTADVVAVVTEAAGTAPQNGTMVTFSSSFGTMTPQEAPTQGGIARSVFKATGSGKAQIQAFSGGAVATPVDVLAGGAAAALVAIRATPSSLPQGGGTVQIIAVVRDASGNTLPGAPVSFTTDQGNLGSTSALTNDNGEAQTSLTTNRDAVVTATVISTITATTTVRIINAPTIQIALATGAATPSVGVGVNFTVTPGPIATGAAIQGASVNFGDGTAVVNLGPISGATNLTHAFNAPGVYIVTASVVDATGQGASSTVSVNVQRLAPVVTLTPASSTITSGQALAFSVTGVPATGGPPVTNIQVTVNPGGTVVYNSSGGGSFTRQFNAPGTYTLTATAIDTAGTTGTSSAIVSVSGLEVTLDATGGTLACGATSPKVCTGLTSGTSVTFTANVTTAGTAAASFTWSYGDNSPNETTTSRVNSHLYNYAGSTASFVATVTVTTTSGATQSQVITLKQP